MTESDKEDVTSYIARIDARAEQLGSELQRHLDSVEDSYKGTDINEFITKDRQRLVAFEVWVLRKLAALHIVAEAHSTSLTAHSKAIGNLVSSGKEANESIHSLIDIYKRISQSA